MPRCQPASPASPKGKYVKKSIDGKRQLKLKLRSKPGAHGERFQGVEKTTSGNFQAFVSKKGKKVGVGTYSTEEEAATQRALDYANNLENVDFGRKDEVDMDLDKKFADAPSAESSPLSIKGWVAENSSGPLCWPPGAATDPPDRAWMIVTGWGVNDCSHLSKPFLQPFI